MNRDSLQIRAALISQDYIDQKIKEFQEKSKEVDKILRTTRFNQFFDYYNIPAKVVMTNYVKRLGECCYQGGNGYRLWLTDSGLPSYCHCVVHPNRYKKLNLPEKKEMLIGRFMVKIWRLLKKCILKDGEIDTFKDQH